MGMTTTGSIEDVPATWEGWYGGSITAKLPDITRLYLKDAGETRRLTCAGVLFTRDYASGEKPATVAPGIYPVRKTMTYYVDWDDQPYDGFIGN